MAVYVTQGDERLFELADRFYGEVSDEAVSSIALANPNAWDGNGVLAGGLTLLIPEPVLNVRYNPAPTSEMSRLIGLLTGGAAVEPVAVGETRNMSAETGGFVNEQEAVRQDVVNRVMTYRGHREWRLSYGTRIWRALAYNVEESLAREAVSVIRAALAPASERYQVDGVRVTFNGQQMRAVVAVTPLFGVEPVEAEITLLSPDLS